MEAAWQRGKQSNHCMPNSVSAEDSHREMLDLGEKQRLSRKLNSAPPPSYLIFFWMPTKYLLALD